MNPQGFLMMLFVILIFASSECFARKAESSQAKTQFSSTKSAGKKDEPLSVKGQASRLSLMTVLQNKQDDINFVRIKQSFKNEILDSNF